MPRARRTLTASELLVLGEILELWGDQNSAADVFFTDRNEAGIFVKDSAGSTPVFVDLTNLGEWHAEGVLSLDELRAAIRDEDLTPRD